MSKYVYYCEATRVANDATRVPLDNKTTDAIHKLIYDKFPDWKNDELVIFLNNDFLIRQGIVNILGQLAVPGALPGSVGFLIADEHIKGLFIPGNGQNALLNGGNFVSLLFVQFPAVIVRRIFQRGQIIRIRQHGGHLQPVAGGHTAARGRVFHILDAEPAQHNAPVGFRIPFFMK